MTRPPRPIDDSQVVADYRAGMSLEQLRVRYGVDYYRKVARLRALVGRVQP